MSDTSRIWMITGCSSGLGRALAEELLLRGERIIVTARKSETLAGMVAGHHNALALKLDVTKPDDILAAVAEAEQKFGGIDVLVNNAGYGYIAAIEEAEKEAYRTLFETNLFGLIEMTRAVLPGMRARKRGHIVNVSSVGGMVGNPGSGYYAGTKFAVIGFSEALSKETTPLGIKVTVVEPGPFRTDWQGRSLKTSQHPIDAYTETVHARVKQLAETSGRQPGDPKRAAQAIITAVDSPEPPLHLVLGAQGLKIARQQLAALQQELDTWEALTLSADFPERN